MTSITSAASTGRSSRWDAEQQPVLLNGFCWSGFCGGTPQVASSLLAETPPACSAYLDLVVAVCPRGVVVRAEARVWDITRAGASASSGAGSKRVDAQASSTGPEGGLRRFPDHGERCGDVLQRLALRRDAEED